MILKQIEGFNDYKVSNIGDVYSEKYNKFKKLKPRLNSKGYLYVNLCVKGKYNG